MCICLMSYIQWSIKMWIIFTDLKKWHEAWTLVNTYRCFCFSMNVFSAISALLFTTLMHLTDENGALSTQVGQTATHFIERNQIKRLGNATINHMEGASSIISPLSSMKWSHERDSCTICIRPIAEWTNLRSRRWPPHDAVPRSVRGLRWISRAWAEWRSPDPMHRFISDRALVKID